MKKSSSSSKLYSPVRKPKRGFLGDCAAACYRQLPGVMMVLLVLGMVLLRASGGTSGSRRDAFGTSNKMHTSSGREVVLLNLEDVKASTCAKHSALMNFTTEEYREYFFQDPGQERYCLLTHIAAVLHDRPGSFIDIGTRVAASALSLMSHGHRVTTIDIPTSNELDHMVMKTFGQSVKDWQVAVNRAAGGNLLTIAKADILSSSDNATKIWPTLTTASLIYLDTYHKPDSRPFERQFLNRLIDIRYEGVVVIDDIYLNHEMQRWFDELVCASDAPYKVYDLTVAGHSSGTGLLDFERNRQSEQSGDIAGGGGGVGARVTDAAGRLKNGGISAARKRGYSLVVGTTTQKLAERAKKVQFSERRRTVAEISGNEKFRNQYSVSTSAM